MHKISPLLIFLVLTFTSQSMDLPCTLFLKESKKTTLDAVYSNNAERVLAALTHERELLEAHYTKAMEPEQEAHHAKVQKILEGHAKNVSAFKKAERELHERELKIRARYIGLLKSYADHAIPYYLDQAGQSRDRERPICKKFLSGAVCLATAFLEGCLVIKATQESSEDTWYRENLRVIAVLHEFKDTYSHEIFRLGKPRIIPMDEEAGSETTRSEGFHI